MRRVLALASPALALARRAAARTSPRAPPKRRGDAARRRARRRSPRSTTRRTSCSAAARRLREAPARAARLPGRGEQVGLVVRARAAPSSRSSRSRRSKRGREGRVPRRQLAGQRTPTRASSSPSTRCPTRATSDPDQKVAGGVQRRDRPSRRPPSTTRKGKLAYVQAGRLRQRGASSPRTSSATRAEIEVRPARDAARGRGGARAARARVLRRAGRDAGGRPRRPRRRGAPPGRASRTGRVVGTCRRACSTASAARLGRHGRGAREPRGHGHRRRAARRRRARRRARAGARA